jgi:hypothetical protein
MPNGINEHGLNKALALRALKEFGRVPNDEQISKFEQTIKVKTGTLKPRLLDGFKLMIDMALNDPQNKDVIESLLNEEIDATLSFQACAVYAREIVKHANTLNPTDDEIKKFEEWIGAKKGSTIAYVREGLEGLRALASRNQKVIDHLRRTETDCGQ